VTFDGGDDAQRPTRFSLGRMTSQSQRVATLMTTWLSLWRIRRQTSSSFHIYCSGQTINAFLSGSGFGRRVCA